MTDDAFGAGVAIGVCDAGAPLSLRLAPSPDKPEVGSQLCWAVVRGLRREPASPRPGTQRSKRSWRPPYLKQSEPQMGHPETAPAGKRRAVARWSRRQQAGRHQVVQAELAVAFGGGVMDRTI